jgi:hypothetical protein
MREPAEVVSEYPPCKNPPGPAGGFSEIRQAQLADFQKSARPSWRIFRNPPGPAGGFSEIRQAGLADFFRVEIPIVRLQSHPYAESIGIDSVLHAGSIFDGGGVWRTALSGPAALPLLPSGALPFVKKGVVSQWEFQTNVPGPSGSGSTWSIGLH